MSHVRHRLRSLATTIAGSSAALLIGCGGATSSAPYTEAPAPHLRRSADGREHRHDIPLPSPDDDAPVTLDGILAFADAQSPVLAVARSSRARGSAARAAASPLFPGNPQVSGQVGPRFGASGVGVDYEIGVTQQIQIAGERGLARGAAERFVELTAAQIEQTRWTVHCDVHAAFHRALVEREKAELAAQVVGFQREILRVVERQLSAGEVAPLTMRLAQAEVAQAEQVALAAAQGYLAARIQLAQLAGWPVSSPPTPAGELDPPRDPPPADALVAIAREHLPSLHARRAAVREAAARVTLADREVWPTPTIGVQIGRESDPGTDGAYDILMGSLSVPFPVFQTNQGERAGARADVEVAEAELDAAARLLEGQVVLAHSEVAAAAQRTRAYGSEILPRFEENLGLLRRTFELGEIDLLSLSVGRERFFQIQSAALSAELDYFVAVASLERVVGTDVFRDEHHEAP